LFIEPDKRSKLKTLTRRFQILLVSSGEHQTIEYAGKPIQVAFHR
jgi:hypothetical protein